MRHQGRFTGETTKLLFPIRLYSCLCTLTPSTPAPRSAADRLAELTLQAGPRDHDSASMLAFVNACAWRRVIVSG